MILIFQTIRGLFISIIIYILTKIIQLTLIATRCVCSVNNKYCLYTFVFTIILILTFCLKFAHQHASSPLFLRPPPFAPNHPPNDHLCPVWWCVMNPKFRTRITCKSEAAPRCCWAQKRRFRCGCWAPERFVPALSIDSSRSCTLCGSSFAETKTNVESRILGVHWIELDKVRFANCLHFYDSFCFIVSNLPMRNHHHRMRTLSLIN